MTRLMTIYVFCCLSSFGLLAQEDALMDILSDELSREFNFLSKQTQPVYYMSYRAEDLDYTFISSSLGSLMQLNTRPARTLNLDIRVGNYTFDNTRTTAAFKNQYNNAIPLPQNNVKESISHTLWLTTDLMYKMAMAGYTMAKNDKKNESSISQDFSKQPAVNYVDPAVVPESIDMDDWSARLNRLSSLLKETKGVIEGNVSLNFVSGKKYFLSSEGTRIIQNISMAEVQVTASIRSSEGEVVPFHQNYFALTPDQLPTEQSMRLDIEKMKTKLDLLRDAPKAEPFSGPAIFSGSVAGVFFHEIFGHRVEADRLTAEFDSQTFKDKLGQKILPKFIDVTFDPTLTTFEGKHLTGTYLYDDEGVKSQKVEIVQAGELKDFLRSRKPLAPDALSNGHSRAQAGMSPVSRQSNLIVKSNNVKSDEALRKMLIKECKKQNKAFGYYIKRVQGGYTMTDRYRPNAFSIAPTEVYKVFVDGRPDQMVRGVDLIGTPLTMFSEIKATGSKNEIFFGYCGAESGYVPVTAIAPSLFVRKIETQKRAEQNIDQPILSDPNQINH